MHQQGILWHMPPPRRQREFKLSPPLHSWHLRCLCTSMRPKNGGVSLKFQTAIQDLARPVAAGVAFVANGINRGTSRHVCHSGDHAIPVGSTEDPSLGIRTVY